MLPNTRRFLPIEFATWEHAGTLWDAAGCFSAEFLRFFRGYFFYRQKPAVPRGKTRTVALDETMNATNFPGEELFATATHIARKRGIVVKTTNVFVKYPPSTVWWVGGGGGARAAPSVGGAVRRGAARSPCPPGMEGRPAQTSNSAEAAWARAPPAAPPKRWPKSCPIPSRGTLRTPGDGRTC